MAAVVKNLNSLILFVVVVMVGGIAIGTLTIPGGVVRQPDQTVLQSAKLDLRSGLDGALSVHRHCRLAGLEPQP